MRVRLAVSAQQQLAETLQHLHRDRPASAVRLRGRIRIALRSIGQFPHSGRIVPEFPELGYREIIVAPYRIFYQVRGDTAWVVSIWHGAQLPDIPDES